MVFASCDGGGELVASLGHVVGFFFGVFRRLPLYLGSPGGVELLFLLLKFLEGFV